MLEYDQVRNLQHHPTPMLRYGLNPYGEPLYRIVFTQSRRHLVGGAWAGEGNTYHWVPKYRQITAPWILERWRPEVVSRKKWETEMVDPVSGWPLLGPYPSRGDYDMVWEFDSGVAADSLDNIVANVERRMLRQVAENQAMLRREYEQEEKDQKRESSDEVRDCLRYRNCAPLSAGRFGRGTKTAPELKTANELGLPITRRNARRNPKDLRGLDVTSSLSVR